jgi:transposase
MKEYKRISIDIAKNVFQICAFTDKDKIAFNKKVSRKAVLNLLRNIGPTLVVLEACYSSNHWARAIQELGHEVLLIPPYQVKPFLVGNKNDANDSIAIGEASFRPKARFVSVKTLHQQDIQTLLRTREQIQKVRIMISNQIRGFLAEYGVICGKGHKALIEVLAEALAPESSQLTAVAIDVITVQMEQYKHYVELEKELENKLIALCKDTDMYRLLQTIPGIGPLIAATLIATIGDPGCFKNARQLAAWLGLTPIQYASGGKSHMGKMSKRGNRSLRKMLIHGARSIINWVKKKDDKLSLWIKSLQQRMNPKKVMVAVANKLTRIAWAVMTYQVKYAAQ